MRQDVHCPRCGQAVSGGKGCLHLRWAPNKGGLLEFAKAALTLSPVTQRRGSRPGAISPEWWQEHREWLQDRVAMFLDVAEGHCFGDPGDIDRLCMEIWHEIEPAPAKTY